jgi:hypothetical protein
LPLIRISTEWVTIPKQGKSSGGFLPLASGQACFEGTREDHGRDYWMCENGTVQQVAEFRDGYMMMRRRSSDPTFPYNCFVFVSTSNCRVGECENLA